MDNQDAKHPNAPDNEQTAATVEEQLEELVQSLLLPDDNKRRDNALSVRQNAHEDVMRDIVDRLVEHFQNPDPEECRLAGTALVWLGGHAVPHLALRLIESKSPELQIGLAAVIERIGPGLDVPLPWELRSDLHHFAVFAENAQVRGAVFRAIGAVWQSRQYSRQAPAPAGAPQHAGCTDTAGRREAP